MADGSITFSTKLDNKDLEKDLAKARKDIQKTEDTISSQEARKSPLVKQAAELEQKMKAARAEVKRCGQDWAAGVAGADKKQSAAQGRLESIQAEYQRVTEQIDKIDNKLLPAYQKLDGMKSKAGELQQQIEKAASSTNRMKDATVAAEKKMNMFMKRVKGLAKRVFVFTIITSALRSLKDWLWSAVKTNDKAVAAFARLKGALLTLAQPIVDTIIPAFIKLVDILTAIVSKIAQFTAKIFGANVKETAAKAEALYNEQQALEGVGDAAKAASKQLASFDEINTLGSDESSGSSSSDITPEFSSAADTGWLDSALGDVSGKVAAALLLGGIALVAIGAATGSIWTVIAGLAILGVGITLAAESNEVASWAEALGLGSASELVADALIIGGIALIVIGACMANLMMVIAGLGLIGATIALADEETKTSWAEALGLEGVVDYVAIAMQLAGIALIAIGACMANIVMVIAGGLLLGLGVAADAIGEEKLKEWWEVLKLTTVQQWVGVAMLLIGIALIAIGACMGNIIMIIAGAVILGIGTCTSAAEGNLKDWVTTLGLQKVVGWVTAALLLIGIALIVFGILTGNIMMILAGAGLLGAGIAIGVTSGTFSSWLDTISGAFASFKQTMLNIFSQLWGGIKNVINSIIGGVEWMANKVINGINFCINALNRINFKLPNWLGGGSFGFNIPNLSNVYIPRLATGAVIPPNREFMAILGDQKSGTNIEAPADLIRKIVREEAGGDAKEIHITVITKLDGKEVARNQVKHINDMTRQAGKPVLLF